MNRKYLIIIILLLALPFEAFCDGKNESEDLRNAWNYVNNGENESALNIIKQYNLDEAEYRDFWMVLCSIISLKNGQWEKSLELIDSSKERLELAYNKIKLQPEIASKTDKENIIFFYKTSLFICGTANYKLGNWSAASRDLLESNNEFGDNSNLNLIAICYYNLNEYQESLEYFKQSYETSPDQELKTADAYNIAALSSMLGNTQDVLMWLKIPLENDKKLWLEKVNTDHDFDIIRDNNDFKSFLKKYISSD